MCILTYTRSLWTISKLVFFWGWSRYEILSESGSNIELNSNSMQVSLRLLKTLKSTSHLAKRYGNLSASVLGDKINNFMTGSPWMLWRKTFSPVLSCWSSTLSNCLRNLFMVFCKLSCLLTSALIAIECVTLFVLFIFRPMWLLKMHGVSPVTHQHFLPVLSCQCHVQKQKAAQTLGMQLRAEVVLLAWISSLSLSLWIHFLILKSVIIS